MQGLAVGFGLVVGLGLFHHLALRTLRALARPPERHPDSSILVAFFGLVVIHTSEIVIFAALYVALLDTGVMGTITLDGVPATVSDLIVFSGIVFSTLGLTDVDPAGPIRFVSMMQSLGGFMVLTWSATFLYSIWREGLDRG